MTDCGCPTGPGRTITDPERHAEWHAVALQQTGLAVVDAVRLRAACGLKTETPLTHTINDTRAEKSGRRISAARRRELRS